MRFTWILFAILGAIHAVRRAWLWMLSRLWTLEGRRPASAWRTQADDVIDAHICMVDGTTVDVTDHLNACLGSFTPRDAPTAGTYMGIALRSMGLATCRYHVLRVLDSDVRNIEFTEHDPLVL